MNTCKKYRLDLGFQMQHIPGISQVIDHELGLYVHVLCPRWIYDLSVVMPCETNQDPGNITSHSIRIVILAIIKIILDRRSLTLRLTTKMVAATEGTIS